MESSKMNEKDKKETLHHKQQELCMTRAAYRQGREFTAVKVYSISSESQHLVVYGVPTINLRSELKSLFNKYGEIITIHVVPDQKVEIFTECYHIHYKRIQSARIAKRLVDARSFYGGVLHVCYAPEYETLEETTRKLIQRKRDVLIRLNKYNAAPEKYSEMKESNEDNRNEHKLSRKRNQFEIDIVSPYNEEDPILSHKKKQRRNAEQTILKYSSQCSDINGGLNDGANKIHKKRANNSFLPVSCKTISTDKVYGPQLPTSTIYSTGNTEDSNIVSSQKIVEAIQDSFEGSSQKNIRKLPNKDVLKRIIFRNKIQNKII